MRRSGANRGSDVRCRRHRDEPAWTRNQRWQRRRRGRRGRRVRGGRRHAIWDEHPCLHARGWAQLVELVVGRDRRHEREWTARRQRVGAELSDGRARPFLSLCTAVVWLFYLSPHIAQVRPRTRADRPPSKQHVGRYHRRAQYIAPYALVLRSIRKAPPNATGVSVTLRHRRFPTCARASSEAR